MITVLTGASGFIGGNFCTAFEDTNDQFVSIGRSTSNDMICDLSKEVPELPSKVSSVIYCAGQAHIENRIKNSPEAVWSNNVIALKNFLNGLNGESVKRFVLISSVSVYGLETGEAITERCELAPVDVYGKAKLQMEIDVTDWCSNFDIQLLIVRLPLVVGKNPPGNLGAMIGAIKKGYFFTVGGGHAKRSMVLVSDVVDFCLRESWHQGTYHLTDGVHPSYRDLSTIIARKYRLRSTVNTPQVVMHCLANIASKFSTYTGIRVHYDLRIHAKMTSSLTFDDTLARDRGWRSQPVLSKADAWL